MQWMILAAALTAEPSVSESFSNQQDATQHLCRVTQTGSLLFSQGDCLAVKAFTMSPYTHVAMVVVKEGVPHVYDSAKGSGVRCQPLTEYMKYLDRNKIHLFQPRRDFSKGDVSEIVDYLDSQIGTEYAVLHHTTGKRADGVHCAEYMTDALMSIELIHAKQPARVSPASLAQGLVQGELYTAAKTICIDPPPKPKANGTCPQLWLDTKTCSKNAWCKMKGWFCCN